MKVIKSLGWTMIGTGTLILLFLGYQLVFTNFLTARAQNAAASALEERFDELREDLPEVKEIAIVPPAADSGDGTATTDPGAVETAAPIRFYDEPTPEDGAEFGRILIPKIEVDQIIFEGVDRETLKSGPGHMPWTPLPGQVGNAVVSGHRTTYGQPFFNLDELEAGDQIVVETLVGSHTYEIRQKLVVLPTDVWVTDHRQGAWLTLTTCHPQFSARERLIIVAELVEGPNMDYAQAVRDGLVERAST